MKHLHKEDLILFYYGELDQKQSKDVRQALIESTALEQEYAELCYFLDNEAHIEVPPPESNLNQQIMSAVYRQVEEQSKSNVKNKVQDSPKSTGIFSWLFGNAKSRYTFASVASLIVVSFVFLFGRWSTQVEELTTVNVRSQALVKTFQPEALDTIDGERVLLSNVSAHLEMSGRLLTIISNENRDLSEEIASRGQSIDDLVAFSRLYRRIIEQKGNRELALVLQQVEAFLIELNHLEFENRAFDVRNIRDRLKGSDLRFRLKITEKKINQQSFQI